MSNSDKKIIEQMEEELDDELFSGVEYKGDWDGYKIYEPILKGFAVVGPPVFYLVKGDTCRLTTYDEGLKIFNKLYPPSEESSDELNEIYNN